MRDDKTIANVDAFASVFIESAFTAADVTEAIDQEQKIGIDQQQCVFLEGKALNTFSS